MIDGRAAAADEVEERSVVVALSARLDLLGDMTRHGGGGKNAAHRGDAGWLAHVAQTASTTFHPTSTCMMGPRDDAVVDTALRVKGLDGLRVVDASIMPAVVSGNTNAATIMIAEKGADMVKQDAKAGVKLAA